MSKKWLKAALIRALRTLCQSMIAGIGTSAVAIHEINWSYVLSVAIVAAILSILTSITGLPEVDLDEISEDNEE